MKIIKDEVSVIIENAKLYKCMIKICSCVDCDGSMEVSIEVSESQLEFLESIINIINTESKTPLDEPILQLKIFNQQHP